MGYNPDCLDCSEVDPIAPVIPGVHDPSHSGLPDGGEPGQVLVIDDDGNPTWGAGGGGGGSVTLYNTTGQSTTGGMTQKAITDELNGKATSVQLGDLQTEVNNKAPQSTVDALSATVAAKADQTDLGALEAVVDGKADAATVSALATEVASKANQGTVDALSSQVALKADTTTVNQALATKADASALDDYYAKSEADALLDDKQDVLTAGQNIAIVKDPQTGETTISATGGDDKVFVAEYGVTTAQDIIAYLDSTNESFAPILVERNGAYYTAVIHTPRNATTVNLSTFGTISGEGYLFSYTITGANWSSSNIGFQTKLVSGTSLKTINGESLLGGGDIQIGGGGTVDQTYDPTSTNAQSGTAVAEAVAGAEYDDTALAARVTANEQAISTKQDTLVSGTNIKTINGQPVVGSGNLILHQGVGDGLDLNDMPSYNELQQMLNNNALLYIDGNWLVTGLMIESSTAQVVGEYADEVRYYSFDTNYDLDAPLIYNNTYIEGSSQKPNMVVSAGNTQPFGRFQRGDGQEFLLFGLANGITISFTDQQGRTQMRNYTINPSYVVDKPEGSPTQLGNVVQVGSFVNTDGTEYGIYEFYYKTSALPAADTTKTYSFSPLLDDYTIFDFIDQSGITSNGHVISSGRTDGTNRIIIQQFSKNNKNVMMRAYGDYTAQTALLRIKFIGTKTV